MRFPLSRTAALVALGLLVLTDNRRLRTEEPKVPAGAKANQVTADLDGYRQVVAPFLQQHCSKCHGAEKKEAGLALQSLNADLVAGGHAKKWRRVLDQLQQGEMPPKGETQPEKAALLRVTAWLRRELAKSPGGDREYRAGTHLPAFGNRVDHQALFHPEPGTVASTPARLWRISPHIYWELVKDLTRGFPDTIPQAFSGIPQHGFKDYAAAFNIDEATTEQLMRNAQTIVQQQTRFRIESGKLKPENGAERVFVDLFDEAKAAPTRQDIESAIRLQFNLALKRAPTANELGGFVQLMEDNIRTAGRREGSRASLAAILLQPEVVFRQEFGAGPSDVHGRRLLAPRELAFAIAYALTDKHPDPLLLSAVDQGKLSTRDDVAREVNRLLSDAKIPKPRILRFFREYFGYHDALLVFKEEKENPDHDPQVLVNDTDQLILHILDQDRQVLRNLLTTNNSFVVSRWGNGQTAAGLKKQRDEGLKLFYANPSNKDKPPPRLGKELFRAYNLDDYPEQQPVELPAAERAGILTQPSWLVAHSLNADNHAIRRGRWVREHLLGGSVPDLPITVDAQLPNDREKTLRERMAVTKANYCWNCHRRMNDLGLPFEQFDHFGRFRTTELNRPVDATGSVTETGSADLDGPVLGAVALIKKLADSERVQQVFIRHAFRYWMGRNETLADGPTLVQANEAYTRSDGSMKALITALLTSDSFLYRVPNEVSKTRPGD
ncbi:MAG: DUF1588 domain-containing protein [Planctomycetia bacterium]|nr:DUF1588 domain-containing protein [Planctomycetia bacterium]